MGRVVQKQGRDPRGAGWAQVLGMLESAWAGTSSKGQLRAQRASKEGLPGEEHAYIYKWSTMQRCMVLSIGPMTNLTRCAGGHHSRDHSHTLPHSIEGLGARMAPAWPMGGCVAVAAT
jgi:hypothetical protein|mmetsp:Transcript_14655/g.38742  ORF Transcript_14655/g.38742 Transcript_14655/m.38742 type:complete len:118 (-) Transcript_14655:71-424(-)